MAMEKEEAEGGGEEIEIEKEGNGDRIDNKRRVERVKGPWSPEEDGILSGLVSNLGARNWSLIARGIPGRSGKSCRLRWCNQLDPCVKRKPFTGNLIFFLSISNQILTLICTYLLILFISCFFFLPLIRCTYLLTAYYYGVLH